MLGGPLGAAEIWNLNRVLNLNRQLCIENLSYKLLGFAQNLNHHRICRFIWSTHRHARLSLLLSQTITFVCFKSLTLSCHPSRILTLILQSWRTYRPAKEISYGHVSPSSHPPIVASWNPSCLITWILWQRHNVSKMQDQTQWGSKAWTKSGSISLTNCPTNPQKQKVPVSQR